MLTANVTSSIHLEMLGSQHAQALAKVTQLNQAYLSKWLPWAHSYRGIGDTLAFIKRARQEFCDQQAGHYIIFHEQQVCGMLSLFNLHADNNACDLGYWLASSKQGEGIITQSVAYVLPHVFTTLHKHKAVIRCAMDNQLSRNIPERLGFVFEGILRDSEKLREGYVSHAVYSLLQSEWRQQSRNNLYNAF